VITHRTDPIPATSAISYGGACKAVATAIKNAYWWERSVHGQEEVEVLEKGAISVAGDHTPNRSNPSNLSN